MKNTIYIGIYVGTILLERDVKYQKWLKAGRPVSFIAHMACQKAQ